MAEEVEIEKEKFDEQLSLLDARARKHRRSSVVITVLLVAVTGALVLQFAADIVRKQAQVYYAESSRGELDKKLKSEQEKLNAATRAREKLEEEVRELEETKRSYQNRILSDKDAHNMGVRAPESQGKPAGSPSAGTKVDPEQQDIPSNAPKSGELIIEESGKAPEGFYIKPAVKVTPGIGASGKDIFKVELSLNLPEAQRTDVETVSYHLSPKFYLRNEIGGGNEAPYEAKFNVFACESTVLARVRLRDGTTLAVDFDWCVVPGWPVRKREPVIVNSEDEKAIPKPAPIPTTAPRPPGIAVPGNGMRETEPPRNSEEPGRH